MVLVMQLPCWWNDPGEFLRADPEHVDDTRVAERHDDGWEEKHDEELVAGERHPVDVLYTVVGAEDDAH